MPPRRRAVAPPGLTDDDVAELRRRVADGDTPRVIVRAASAAVAAGTRGNVIRFGDPKENEYVVVRLGRDEVPFAPGELGLTSRKAATTSAPARTSSARKAPMSTATAAARAPAKASVRAAPPAPAPSSSQPVTARRTRAAAGSTAKTSPAKATPAKRAAGRSRGAGRKVPPLVVTMRFRDGEWSVEAQRGARRLSRPGPLRPGAVSAFAEHVDDDAVRDALVETVDSCRAVVEERAAALRAELQAAEASLRDYDARPGRR